MLNRKRPVTVGVIGAGNISPIYLQADSKFSALRITQVADLDMGRAAALAKRFGKQAVTVEELLANPEIEIVVNLTPPEAHAAVAMQALGAGKHVYNEKPLAVEREDAQALLAMARMRGLRVGCAPDTFLGGGYQTCRALIDAGAIGRPVFAAARMLSSGPEHWHPNPHFFYKRGAGPLFDIGPYYLTALVALLGMASRAVAMARITHAERIITSQPCYGQIIPVEVPTLVIGTLEFGAGVLANLIVTFDAPAMYDAALTIYGTDGVLQCPDPNTFGGPVRLLRKGKKNWEDVPIAHRWVENARGIGVAEMAEAIRKGRPHRAGTELAYHVLDLMHALSEAANEGRCVNVSSTCDRPEPLPAEWDGSLS
ncbi:MAG: Gfo/Idh/MocA family protein [Thermoflexales bacterium]